MKIELTGKDLFYLVLILLLAAFCLVNFLQIKNAMLWNTVNNNSQSIENITTFLNNQVQAQQQKQQPVMRLVPEEEKPEKK